MTVDERDIVVPPVVVNKATVAPTPTVTTSADAPIVAADVSGGRIETPVVETSSFQTLGVSWPKGSVADPAALSVQVRTRAAGTWTAWEALGVDDGGADAGTAEAARTVRDGTDSLWVGAADAVQLSFGATATGGPSGMSLALISSPVNGSTGAATAAPAVFTSASTVTPASSTVADVTSSAAPVVISRAQWGARAPVCDPGSASTLVGATLHHTAGPNTYSSVAEAEAQIRNDQQYHIGTRGWCDLGYNFVVDKWGNIYEGRAGSLNSPVIGAHAGGFNTGTVGVAMLGTYDAAPSGATQTAVAQIIGWRLGAYGVDPSGSMSYATTTGENSKYSYQTVALPRVFGHRDVAYTACPGNGGYAALPGIRAMASEFSSYARFGQANSVVKAMYADILGRGVDPSGLLTWSGMLASGAGGPALVASLTNSDEYVLLRIRQAYTQVLGRDGEPAGVANWYSAIRSGVATVDDVQRKFLSSAEFMSRAGGTEAGYVTRMYTSVLGRAPAPEEVNYWVGVIAQIGRESVTDGIWFSHEAAVYRSGTYYQTFLKRAPDAAGNSLWADVLLTQGEGAVRIGIAGSEEYRQKALVRFP